METPEQAHVTAFQKWLADMLSQYDPDTRMWYALKDADCALDAVYDELMDEED
jgi:hypothetical protein